MMVDLANTKKGKEVILMIKDREIVKDEDCNWIFLKIIASTTNKRTINDYLQICWGIKSWVQLSSSSFMLGMKDRGEY